MDVFNRVSNIKKRFENINRTCNEGTSICKDITINGSNTHNKDVKAESNTVIAAKFIATDETALSVRPNIKRTPAFRRDKVPIRNKARNDNVKPSIVSRRVHLFNKIDDMGAEKTQQYDELFQKSEITSKGPKVVEVSSHKSNDTSVSNEIMSSYSQMKTPSKNTKVMKSKKKSVSVSVSSVDEFTKNLSHEIIEKSINEDVKNNIVNKENNERLTNMKNSNEVNDLSDTLKRVLQSPLPPGPPPKKPPRTFTSSTSAVVNVIKPDRITCNIHMKFNDIHSGSTLKKYPCQWMTKIQQPIRSKTELETKLKNIENALSRHQKHAISLKSSLPIISSSPTDLKQEKFAGIHKNNRRSSDKGSLSQLSSCLNDFRCSSRSKSVQYASSPFFAVSCPSTVIKKNAHIYEDPQQLNLSTLPAEKGNQDDSLYYMSTPIEKIINPSESSQKYPMEANKFCVKVNSPFNDYIDGDSNVKSVGYIDNKIKLWMNEAYSESWTKLSDASSDSDSVQFLNHDEQPSSENKKEREIVEEYDQLTLNRKGYVQRVASKVISRTQSVLAQTVTDCKHLFDCLLLIGLNLDVHNRKVPYIKMKYPNNINVPQWIEHMCFPDAHDWSNNLDNSNDDKFSEERCYVIPLTTEVGLRKYAYCCRIKPEGESHSLPLSYCILSHHKANEFYFKVLKEIENKHGESELEFNKFIRELYFNAFPRNGQEIEISALSQDGQEKEKGVIRRPRDTRQENLRLSETLTYLRFDTFSLLFSSLLLERRVILLSSSISKLSACIEGLQVALLPFEWQHTLITVVPSDVISVADLCDAPTPYLIGLLKPKSTSAETLPQLNNKLQVLIIDLDEKKAIHKVGDENSILPNHLAKGLKNALQPAHSSEMNTNNLLACEAFTRFFVEALGHYRRYIVLSGDNLSQRRFFQKETFIKAAPTHQIRMFLEWFVETSAFNVFINLRIHNADRSRDLFEQRCNEYYEEINKSKYEKNNKINKTVKQIGDLIKDWTNSS